MPGVIVLFLTVDILFILKISRMFIFFLQNAIVRNTHFLNYYFIFNTEVTKKESSVILKFVPFLIKHEITLLL